MRSESPLSLPPLSQVGVVVRDVDRTATFYHSTFGIGPFGIIPEVKFEGALLRGRPTSTSIKVAFAQSGPIQIELIQPLEGQNIYTEFLAAKGEGLHHLGFEVDDFHGHLAYFKSKGIDPIFWHNMGWMAFAYLGTDKIGGVMIELLWYQKQQQAKR
jgi:catechol 2,3-dioxygenase-like lactoylglutathione lyase family enzyme